MSDAELSLLVGFASAGVQVLTVPIGLRLFRRVAPVLVHVVGAVGIHLGATLLAWGMLPPFPYWHGACLFGFISIFYLFGFSAVYKSVSLTVLRKICKSGGMPLELVVQQHVLPSFTERMDLLVAMGLVQHSDQAFVPTPLGREKAANMLRLHAALGIRKGGLYGFSVPGDPAPKN